MAKNSELAIKRAVARMQQRVMRSPFENSFIVVPGLLIEAKAWRGSKLGHWSVSVTYHEYGAVKGTKKSFGFKDDFQTAYEKACALFVAARRLNIGYVKALLQVVPTKRQLEQYLLRMDLDDALAEDLQHKLNRAFSDERWGTVSPSSKTGKCLYKIAKRFTFGLKARMDGSYRWTYFISYGTKSHSRMLGDDFATSFGKAMAIYCNHYEVSDVAKQNMWKRASDISTLRRFLREQVAEHYQLSSDEVRRLREALTDANIRMSNVDNAPIEEDRLTPILKDLHRTLAELTAVLDNGDVLSEGEALQLLSMIDGVKELRDLHIRALKGVVPVKRLAEIYGLTASRISQIQT